jgi:hypothetical protein
VKRFLLLLALAVFPSSLFANTLDFPQVVYGGGFTTIFVINNTGTTDVTAQLNIYSQGGVLQSVSTTITIKAGASARFSVSTGTTATLGWAEFVAANTTVAGVATFEYRGGDGKLSTAAGVLGVEATNSFLLPVEVTATSSTGIAIANTTTGVLIYQLRVVSASGAAVTTSQRSLGPRGQEAKHIDEYISSLSGTAFNGTVYVETLGGATGLAVTAIVQKEGLLSASAVIPVSGGGSTRLSYPQAVIGSGFTSSFIVINVGTTTVNSSLNFYSQLGVPLTQYQQTVVLAPGGSFRYSTPDGSGITVAWADIDGGAGASLRGVGTYEYRSGGVLQTTVGVLGIAGSNTFTLPVDQSATGRTSFALSNLSANGVNVGLRLLNEDGTQFAISNDPRLNPIPGHGQIALYVDELFPQLVGTTFQGALVIEAASGSPANTLVATALTTKEGIFSALPAIPTGPGGSGGTGGTGGGGGTGGTGGGAASACLDTNAYNNVATIHYEYNVGGPLLGSAIYDIVVTPNATYEGQTASESALTLSINFTGLGSSATKGKSYGKLDGLDLLSYGGTADTTSTFAGTTTSTSTKTVNSPPCRNKQFSLAVGASDTQSCTSTTTTNGVTSTGTVNTTVKYLGQESVTVPSGTYNACKFQSNNGDLTEWYAVGYPAALVRSSTTTQAGDTVLELKAGTINGTTIHP